MKKRKNHGDIEKALQAAIERRGLQRPPDHKGGINRKLKRLLLGQRFDRSNDSGE